MLQHQRFFCCSCFRQVQFLQAPKLGFQVVDLFGVMVDFRFDTGDEALLGCDVGGCLRTQFAAAVDLAGKVGFFFYKLCFLFFDLGCDLKCGHWVAPFSYGPL